MIVKQARSPTSSFEATQVNQVVTRTYRELLQTRRIAERVRPALPLPMTVDELLASVSVNIVSDSQLLLVTAEGSTPLRAQPACEHLHRCVRGRGARPRHQQRPRAGGDRTERCARHGGPAGCGRCSISRSHSCSRVFCVGLSLRASTSASQAEARESTRRGQPVAVWGRGSRCSPWPVGAAAQDHAAGPAARRARELLQKPLTARPDG